MTKKKQSTTLSLQTFLAETETSESSWVDDNHELPTAPLPRDSRHTSSYRDDRRAPAAGPRKVSDKEVPMKPPFTVHVGHLPLDMNEDSLGLIFHNRGCVVACQPRIVKVGDVSKGFGYVELTNRESMIKALELNGYRVKNKSISVDVAAERNHSFDRQSNKPNMNNRPPKEVPADDPKLAAANWRSEKKPSPKETEPPSKSLSDRPRSPPPSSSPRDSRFHRNETDSHPKSRFRSRSRSGHRQRQDQHHSYNRSNTYQNRGDFQRDSQRDSQRNFQRDSQRDSQRDFQRDSHRDSQRDFQRDSHRDSYSQNRDNYRRGSSRSAERNRHSQDQRRGNSFYRSEQLNSSRSTSNDLTRKPAATSEARPKLNIAPRTLPLPDASASSTPSSAVTPPSSSNKPNPFGAAKPVDNSLVIKKVEEKIEAMKLSRTKPTTDEASESTSKTPSRSRSPLSRSSPRSRSRSARRKHDAEHDSVVSNDPETTSIDTTKEISSKA